MKQVALEETTLTAVDLARMAKKGTVILTRKGKPLAAVKVLSRADRESLALANNPRFIAIIEESRRAYHEEGGIGLEEIRQELGLTTKRPRRNQQPGRKKNRRKG